MNCLFYERELLNTRFIRRETSRDKWIAAATKELLGTGISAYARLVRLKDAVASDYGQARTLWLTAETSINSQDNADAHELDWLFGFQIPRQHMKDGKSQSPVPGPERRPPPPKPEWGEEPALSDEELAAERKRLELAQQYLTAKPRKNREKLAKLRMRKFVEAWNLADTEAWKFVRAFNARRSIERRKWEDEERAFLGQGLWDRLDRLVDKII